jgi:hypothetical protein
MQTLIPIEAVPDAPENFEDGCFALQELARTAFADLPGDFVAVYQKKAVGSGDDEASLRQRLAGVVQVEPDRFFVVYKGA